MSSQPRSYKGIKPPSGGIVVRPPAPNAGLRAKYAAKMKKLNERMTASVQWWISSTYRARESEVVGDASPAAEAMKEIARLARQWGYEYGQQAASIAKWFVSTADTTTTSSLFSSLRQAVPTVKPKMTRRTQNILTAMTTENVGLIKSIPSKYFEQIEGAVMRAMANGRDLETLKKEILALGESTDKRAEFIARDQVNKATSVINRARQRDLGITKAVWMHMRGGKHPRHSHVEADGKEFELAKGMYLDGKWIQPGEEPNCGCQAGPVLPEFG
ncbi:MAG TPA: phage minor head protein [Pseudomonas sp.]|uniref:phage head morphogenesis protein n=1 Tax=Pseudomonas sp. TaxID=306 RepID=UPI002BFCC270|nr:phage minor head protein [Pseudomonas sp.]HWH86171.1 phage minor head protein [Pseudomonas sp.]